MLCMFDQMSKMGKERTDTFFITPFLIWYCLNLMLYMSKMSKMGKEHTHTFWFITSRIFNGLSIRKSFGKLRLRAFQPYHQILCILQSPTSLTEIAL